MALDPFLPPDGALTAGARPILDFSEARARSDADLYTAVAEKLASVGKAGGRAVLAASSAGALDRLKRLIAQDGGFEAIQTVDDLDAAHKTPAGVATALSVGPHRRIRAAGSSRLPEPLRIP